MLIKSVESALSKLGDSYRPVKSIQVSGNDELIKLTGQVPTYYIKSLICSATAKAVAGRARICIQDVEVVKD